MAMQGPSGDVAAEVEQPKDAIEVLFTYHAPTPEQTDGYGDGDGDGYGYGDGDGSGDGSGRTR